MVGTQTKYTREVLKVRAKWKVKSDPIRVSYGGNIVNKTADYNGTLNVSLKQNFWATNRLTTAQSVISFQFFYRNNNFVRLLREDYLLSIELSY